jgi:hypothetical protein
MEAVQTELSEFCNQICQREDKDKEWQDKGNGKEKT